MCNLKLVKMRGIFSEVMIMCVSIFEKVEILNVFVGFVIGDRVICKVYLGICRFLFEILDNSVDD